MALDLRVWPVRTAPICADGARTAFQIRRKMIMRHQGEWDLAAEWTPVWIGFGGTWHTGDEPLPWTAHAGPKPLAARATTSASTRGSEVYAASRCPEDLAS